jgi:hypothetical protein
MLAAFMKCRREKYTVSPISAKHAEDYAVISADPWQLACGPGSTCERFTTRGSSCAIGARSMESREEPAEYNLISLCLVDLCRRPERELLSLVAQVVKRRFPHDFPPNEDFA